MTAVKLRRCPPRNQRGGEESKGNWPALLNIAVADEGGNIVAHVRMDNA